MTLADDQLSQKAKATSFRLLKLRPRSTQEIRDRLLQKNYPAQVVEQVVSELAAMGVLDDDAFAKAWVRWRLSGRPVGLRKLAQELRLKGIDKDTAGRYLAEAREEYDELVVVRVLAGDRVRFYKGLPLLKRRKRLFDYLLRRGFSVETINKVIREL